MRLYSQSGTTPPIFRLLNPSPNLPPALSFRQIRGSFSPRDRRKSYFLFFWTVFSRKTQQLIPSLSEHPFPDGIRKRSPSAPCRFILRWSRPSALPLSFRNTFFTLGSSFFRADGIQRWELFSLFLMPFVTTVSIFPEFRVVFLSRHQVVSPFSAFFATLMAGSPTPPPAFFCEMDQLFTFLLTLIVSPVTFFPLFFTVFFPSPWHLSFPLCFFWSSLILRYRLFFYPAPPSPPPSLRAAFFKVSVFSSSGSLFMWMLLCSILSMFP